MSRVTQNVDRASFLVDHRRLRPCHEPSHAASSAMLPIWAPESTMRMAAIENNHRNSVSAREATTIVATGKQRS